MGARSIGTRIGAVAATVLLVTLVLVTAAPAAWFDIETKVLPPSGEAFDRFGISAAIDGGTAVVGAIGDDDAGFGAGAAYVLTRRASGLWETQQKLTASDAADSDQPQFGQSVAIDGDTIVVGAWFANAPNPRSGAAYVYTRTGDVWTETQRLVAPVPVADDHLGQTVAISGDVIVVASHKGRVHAFEFEGGVWAHRQELTASDGRRFGSDLAVDGDTILVGDGGHDANGTNAGLVYVFERDGAGWVEIQQLASADIATGDRFGQSVSMDGNRAVIGAFGDDIYGIDSGSAYVFVESDGVWAEAAKLIPGGGTMSDWFGYSVAMDAGTVAVGAGLRDETAADTGAVFAYEEVGGLWIPLATMAASDAAAGDSLGLAVAISRGNIIAGARVRADLGEDSGAAYIFERVSPAESCDGLLATIIGTNGDDLLVGTAGPDVIAALAGDDRVLGLGGDDLICGGPGADLLIGGLGRDVLLGGAGSDDIRAGGGADVLVGGSGQDSLRGGPGADHLRGGLHDDVLAGNAGGDELDGGPGDDSLYGGDGRDDLDGGTGLDICRSGEILFRCEA